MVPQAVELVHQCGRRRERRVHQPEGFAEADAAKEEIRSIVDPLLDNWIVNPDDSAISHWLHDGMPEGQTRDREYIYPTLYVYLLGAMQEPGHAMGSTLVGLFNPPDQFERVIDEPALIPPRHLGGHAVDLADLVGDRPHQHEGRGGGRGSNSPPRDQWC